MRVQLAEYTHTSDQGKALPHVDSIVDLLMPPCLPQGESWTSNIMKIPSLHSSGKIAMNHVFVCNPKDRTNEPKHSLYHFQSKFLDSSTSNYFPAKHC